MGGGGGGGGGAPDDAPTTGSGPSPDVIYFWVTNDQYTGDLGGLTGADQKCADQSSGNVREAPLPGLSLPSGFTYRHRAMLRRGGNAEGNHPRNLAHIPSAKELHRPDGIGTKIADNYAQFWDPGVATIDASVSNLDYFYWTGILRSAQPSHQEHCAIWTSDDDAITTSIGVSGASDFDRFSRYLSGDVAGSRCDNGLGNTLLCASY